MSELAVFKQRIEDGKADLLREWGEKVHEREEEALASLADEGVQTEAAFIEHADDGSYLVSFMEADDIETAMDTFESSDHDIDEEFQRVLAEALVGPEPVTEFEPLYALRRPRR